MYGIPYDFLSEEQIELMRLGLPRANGGKICGKLSPIFQSIYELTFTAPPNHPLYPEPQPLGQGRYILDPSTYVTHLPRKFHRINHDASIPSQVEVIVVQSDGALTVEPRENFSMHTSQWTHFDGYGGYRLDDQQVVDDTVLKEQGPGRRWSYLPWTREQEESCRPLRIDLRSSAKRKEVQETGK